MHLIHEKDFNECKLNPMSAKAEKLPRAGLHGGEEGRSMIKKFTLPARLCTGPGSGLADGDETPDSSERTLHH